MVRNLFICLLFVCAFSHAQYSVKGTIDPDLNYSWILLYKLENGNQTYMDNADVVDGEFEFKIDEKEPSGVYRAYYQIENNLYVEFLYNKEKVAFSFNPDNPQESIQFSESEENNLTHSYYSLIRYHQKKIDSLQVLFFKSTEEIEDQKIRNKYQDELSVLKEKQVQFEQKSKGKLANHFIRASGNYNAESPFKDPEDYINYIKAHFFDSIDPKDTVLSHSSFINDRLHDYVFYLNQADNADSKNSLQQEAIDKAVNWIDNDYVILKNFEEALIQEYLTEENTVMIYFVIDQYYNLLPAEYQDDELKKRVLGTLRTAVGIKAPDFEWQRDGEKKSLYQLSGADYYIVLFFSADCPHCQVEIPEFYNFISGIENIKVVAIGLEDEKENWEQMTGSYHEFINILDLDKWSGTKVRDYGVTAIPSYFVLDASKKILAKPEDFNELKSLFETK